MKQKLKIKVDFEDEPLYKGEFDSFPKARKLLKDLEKKIGR